MVICCSRKRSDSCCVGMPAVVIRDVTVAVLVCLKESREEVTVAVLVCLKESREVTVAVLVCPK